MDVIKCLCQGENLRVICCTKIEIPIRRLEAQGMEQELHSVYIYYSSGGKTSTPPLSWKNGIKIPLFGLDSSRHFLERLSIHPGRNKSKPSTFTRVNVSHLGWYYASITPCSNGCRWCSDYYIFVSTVFFTVRAHFYILDV